MKISFNDFRRIIYTANQKIVDYLLETGEIIKMPFGLGTLIINKYKPVKERLTAAGNIVSNYSIDWKETNAQGKYVYHLNPHTEGYKYYFMWDWHIARIKCAFIWKFEMCRMHSRKLTAMLQERGAEYKNIYKEIKKH